MKVLFTANMPAPYRVDFFNELGKFCDLTVVFERKHSTVRDGKWKGTEAKSYREVFLKGIRAGEAESVSFEIIRYVKDRSFDQIIVGMYSSPTSMIAIEYMRLHRIPFILSTDGGFIKDERSIIQAVKRHFISSACAWLSPSDKATDYLVHYGADSGRVHKYPFTSLRKSDLTHADQLCSFGKHRFRKELSITEEKVLLSVGRFSYQGGYGKGYDTLLKSAGFLTPDIGIYIVGDEPTNEFINWKSSHGLDHVHFVGFKTKEELARYYAAADVFILLTRGDVWGLVINEAMSFSLPVITTKQCLAGVELVNNGENGFLIEAGEVAETIARINAIFSSDIDLKEMGSSSREKINAYTIENMASAHYLLLKHTSSFV